jgi:DNA transposition AAA+ family ATPase
VPALEEVAEACGIQDPAGGARRIARQIRAKVRGTHGLIIIDEAQHLSMAAVEELRSIHDVTKVGLALVGNETSYARIASGNRAAHFAQINSRLGLKLFLRRPTGGDVKAVAAHWKVTDEETVKLLERVALRPGALRSVVKVLRLAGAGTAKTLTFDRVRAAVDNLGADT